MTSANASCGARANVGPSHHAVWSNHRVRSTPDVHEGSVLTETESTTPLSPRPGRRAYAARAVPLEKGARDGELVALLDRRRRRGRARGARALDPRRGRRVVRSRRAPRSAAGAAERAR